MLTKLHVNALRKATRVVFAHGTERSGEAKTEVRAIKEYPQTDANPFAHEESVTIPATSHLDDYAEGGARTSYTAARDGKYSAFEMIYANDPCWRTIANLLREKDELELRWIRDNNNGHVKDAHLHNDCLNLRVRRDGKAKLEFRLGESICTENTARMVRVPYSSTRAAEATNENAAA